MTADWEKIAFNPYQSIKYIHIAIKVHISIYQVCKSNYLLNLIITYVEKIKNFN
jgi:hypothetical protein